MHFKFCNLITTLKLKLKLKEIIFIFILRLSPSEQILMRLSKKPFHFFINNPNLSISGDTY